MGKFDSNKFESNNQSGETPSDLFEKINSHFNFTRDVCADDSNTKCSVYYTESNSCLDKTWDGINWMNPPFKNMRVFVKKACDERNNAITVCLIPAKTNTIWWHTYCMLGSIFLIKGRPKFNGYKHGLPQPLALVVFGEQRKRFGAFDIKTGELIEYQAIEIKTAKM